MDWIPLAIGYFLGSIPFGLLLTRMIGIDIRQVGSGNIGATNCGGFCNRDMVRQGRFDLHGTEAVACHIQYVVNSPHDPDVAIGIAAGAIGSEIVAGHIGPVGLPVTLVIAIQRPQHGWPRLAYNQQSAFIGSHSIAVLVNNFSNNAR